MAAASWLGRRYGDRVQVGFFDLDEATTRVRFQEIVESLKAGDLPLPVIEIGGRLVPQPYFAEWAIIELVHAAMAGK